MKILIISDSHGNIAAMKKAVEREKPDRVFHLGDLCADAQRLARAYPELSICTVAGNCDAWGGEGDAGPDQLLVTAEGVRFFLTHGHRYHVKLGLGMVVSEGKKEDANVVCFGHTHKALCTTWTGGVWVVNPGSVGGVNAPATYAVAEVKNGEVSVELKEL